jgi:hypothetical protein
MNASNNATVASTNISLSSTGATTKTVAVSGTVYALPNITGNASVYETQTLQLTGSATAAASNAWVSSNTSVATISNSGLVTGIVSGTSTITYTNNNGCAVSTVITVVPQAPAITTSGTLTTFTKCASNVSNSQTFTVTGVRLVSNVNIAALSGVEYSLDGNNYSTTLSLTPVVGTLSATSIFVRLTSTSASSVSGNIQISATNANTINVNVVGNTNLTPGITLSNIGNATTLATNYYIAYTSTSYNPTLYSVMSASPTPMPGF